LPPWNRNNTEVVCLQFRDNRRVLGILANSSEGNTSAETGYYEMDDQMNIVPKTDDSTATFIREKWLFLPGCYGWARFVSYCWRFETPVEIAFGQRTISTFWWKNKLCVSAARSQPNATCSAAAEHSTNYLPKMPMGMLKSVLFVA